MELTLERQPSADGSTDGDMYVGEDWYCYTLEDEIREVAGVPVDQWKVKGQTAIPQGRYRITLEASQRFGPDTMTINNVRGFSAVRMHGGNTAADTEGCPMLGMKRTDTGIANCKPAVDGLKAEIRTALGNGESVWLEITNQA